MHFVPLTSLQERRRFYLDISHTLLSRSATRSWIFESLCHDALSAGGEFKVLPMVKVDSTGAWMKGTDEEDSIMTLWQRTPRIYSEAEEADSKVYYIPEGGDIDAFMLDVGIGFKMSIASGASMKKQGLLGPAVKNLVFVIPSGHTTFDLQDANFGSEVRLYTMEMDVQAESTDSYSKFPDGAFDLGPGEVVIEEDLVLRDYEEEG